MQGIISLILLLVVLQGTIESSTHVVTRSSLDPQAFKQSMIHGEVYDSLLRETPRKYLVYTVNSIGDTSINAVDDSGLRDASLGGRFTLVRDPGVYDIYVKLETRNALVSMSKVKLDAHELVVVRFVFGGTTTK